MPLYIFKKEPSTLRAVKEAGGFSHLHCNKLLCLVSMLWLEIPISLFKFRSCLWRRNRLRGLCLKTRSFLTFQMLGTLAFIVSSKGQVCYDAFWRRLVRIQGTKVQGPASYQRTNGQLAMANKYLEQYLHCYMCVDSQQSGTNMWCGWNTGTTWLTRTPVAWSHLEWIVNFWLCRYLHTNQFRRCYKKWVLYSRIILSGS